MEDTYTWISNIIDSCHNDFHFDCADVLISVYNIQYADTDRVLALRLLQENKWNSV